MRAVSGVCNDRIGESFGVEIVPDSTRHADSPPVFPICRADTGWTFGIAIDQQPAPAKNIDVACGIRRSLTHPIRSPCQQRRVARVEGNVDARHPSVKPCDSLWNRFRLVEVTADSAVSAGL